MSNIIIGSVAGLLIIALLIALAAVLYVCFAIAALLFRDASECVRLYRRAKGD